ncbi:UDP-2,3-diacylglucosamine diphosphatase [Aliidiomarina sedimenti]|uniref:UDP-2,3-diacylglucosamine hydrolase n=1 Tax=Aliidiomarina sedimenti TaxID=1933879 RepID=A0ABY0C346_9GAMM|nr:UDP-2,3-diacylglucosamine diphosphatase [Aliidiomarina sedimenti]RUO32242.1 UDP-2,3-diacylglucosamine diphosphatase [Aliidiomarina sedimenti]
MSTLFISDLHLSAERPDITGLFIHFLQHEARQADALYILGDLFDAWIGDDDLTPFHCRVINALRALTDSDVAVYFIAGNRDFLIGRRFARMTGVTLLPESAVIDLYGSATLIMHGDTLCTLDTGYLRFRKVIRNRVLLTLLTRLPLAWRRALAAKLRSGSASQQPLSDEQLRRMDATEEAVQAALGTSAATRLIHGHTHRPDIHQHQLPDGQQATRIVLGDWYEQGSILAVHPDNTFELRNEPLS